MKNIIGLDLGTNSIGWAVVTVDDDGITSPNIALGSRIIPMSQDVLGKFDSGVTESQTAKRTSYRGIRRLRERELLRRERLFRVLHVLDFLPPHFSSAIGWDRNDNKTYGKFLENKEPKLAWTTAMDGKNSFIFRKAFDEMLAEFFEKHPEMIADGKKIPMDWTIYYLRHKALTRPISKEELAWIILNFNQKRGYYQLRGEKDVQENGKNEEYVSLKVISVETADEGKGGKMWYDVRLENGWVYRRQSNIPMDDWVEQEKDFIVTTEYDKDGKLKLDDYGEVKRSLRAPGPNDWTLHKKKTESQIIGSHVTVGTFIYNTLLETPGKKIR